MIFVKVFMDLECR